MKQGYVLMAEENVVAKSSPNPAFPSGAKIQNSLIWSWEALQILQQRRTDWGFPGGSVVKNLPANAGDTALIPDRGRCHMPQGNKAPVPQPLSLCSRAWEPQLLSPRASSPCSAMSSPYTATREGPSLAATRKSPHSSQDPAQPKVSK